MINCNHIKIEDNRYIVKRVLLQKQIKSQEQLNAWIEYNHADKSIEYDDKILILELIDDAIVITDEEFENKKYKFPITQQNRNIKLNNYKRYGKQIQRNFIKKNRKN